MPIIPVKLNNDLVLRKKGIYAELVANNILWNIINAKIVKKIIPFLFQGGTPSALYLKSLRSYMISVFRVIFSTLHRTICNIIILCPIWRPKKTFSTHSTGVLSLVPSLPLICTFFSAEIMRCFSVRFKVHVFTTNKAWSNKPSLAMCAGAFFGTVLPMPTPIINLLAMNTVCFDTHKCIVAAWTAILCLITARTRNIKLFMASNAFFRDFCIFHTISIAHMVACEKPLPLLRHIITASSRPGDTILDCCMGSGSTLDAAHTMWT